MLSTPAATRCDATLRGVRFCRMGQQRGARWLDDSSLPRACRRLRKEERPELSVSVSGALAPVPRFRLRSGKLFAGPARANHGGRSCFGSTPTATGQVIVALSFSLSGAPERPWRVEQYEGDNVDVRFAQDVRFVAAEGTTMSLADRSAPGGRRHVVRFQCVIARWIGDVLELTGE